MIKNHGVASFYGKLCHDHQIDKKFDSIEVYLVEGWVNILREISNLLWCKDYIEED
ncbi:MAG: hypothetical protein Q4P25_01255 [Tissierellia bacterium]|nr:hypothetical protein [Tissierellia bacterium]